MDTELGNVKTYSSPVVGSALTAAFLDLEPDSTVRDVSQDIKKTKGPEVHTKSQETSSGSRYRGSEPCRSGRDPCGSQARESSGE